MSTTDTEGMALDNEGRVLRKPDWFSAAEYQIMVRERDFWKGVAIRRQEEIVRLTELTEFFRRKSEYWLTAYQNDRVKHVGDYTHRFVRRPRLRRIIQFLMRL